MAYKITGACIEVHKICGSGLFENFYHECLKREFDIREIKYKSELEIPFDYKGKDIDCKVRCDFLLEDLVVLEIKSVAELTKLYEAQTLNYMNLLKAPKGILVNFNVGNLYHEGHKTYVNKYFNRYL